MKNSIILLFCLLQRIGFEISANSLGGIYSCFFPDGIHLVALSAYPCSYNDKVLYLVTWYTTKRNEDGSHAGVARHEIKTYEFRKAATGICRALNAIPTKYE